MNVLLSIKPQYVEKILNGTKKYEFRRILFKKPVRRIEIYSSSPVKKLVGFFVPGKIVEDSPANLWKHFQNDAGVTKKEFFAYFHKKEIGFAIEIVEIATYPVPIDPFEEDPDFIPPQSYTYRSSERQDNEHRTGGCR